MKTEIVPTEVGAPVYEFAQLFSSTPRGARLARLMGTQQLAAWGRPYDDDVSRTAALLIGELAANAAVHGRVRGRSFRLRLLMGPGLLLPATLRIEVADARDGFAQAMPELAPEEAESGRGLLLVDAMATRWGIETRDPSGKTVWAELGLGGPAVSE
ncbi:ATP-binding protein [Streptomyces winkii]|uniref:ATP-binding protein n=1 Tax=Streptomyces winkii TaxID=3051178 RepID=UPI0028D0D840|nr:ATP-binding protein [Streptomyces sp. DSM 40971]